jgi:PKD repeat protein
MTDSIPIIKWVWEFGDSTVITRTTNDTVMHQYAFPGNYPATLTVIDSNGCSATATLAFNYVVVNGPKADFYWNPAATQLGSPITFFNSTTTGGAGATYKWHFSSDGFTSTAPVYLVRTYMTPTVDTVRLIAT